MLINKNISSKKYDLKSPLGYRDIETEFTIADLFKLCNDSSKSLKPVTDINRFGKQ